MAAQREPAAALHPDCIRFLAYLRDIRKYSAHTVNNYRLDLSGLSALFASTPPTQVRPAQIRKLTNQLHARQLLPRSIARHLSCWRGFFAWLSNDVGADINPVQGIKAPRQAKSLPKALSVDDAVHLAGTQLGTGASDAADHAMFELLYSSGLRVSELVSLDVAYVRTGDHVSAGWIDLTERMVHVTGKGNKARSVPIGAAAVTALSAWLLQRPALCRTDHHALFLTRRGARMSARLVQTRIRTHAQRLGINSSVHPHVLRHSFASHMLQSSGDLRAVQELLGHASLASTQVYTALDFQHLAQIYDAAHPRAKIK